MAATMTAAVCTRLDERLSGLELQHIPIVDPGPGQILVRVMAAGINFPDVLMCQGRYQFRPDPPFVPGMEIAGHVAGLGQGVQGLAVGDAVMGGARLGGFADFALLDAANAHMKPDSLSMEQAAAFQTAWLTAWVALVRRGNLQAGETLLVHGAAGGVGMASVDLGLHLGATVIAVASTPQKRAILQARGVHHVIDPAGGFKDQVKQLTGGRGADVIVDPVGGDAFDGSCRCIAFGGRLLVVGFAGGRIATLPSNLPLIKGFSVIGVRAGEHARQRPDEGAAHQAAILDLAARGIARVHVGAALPLSRVRDGLCLLLDRRVTGKVVLVPEHA
jgi:NADPH:quinone reductase